MSTRPEIIRFERPSRRHSWARALSGTALPGSAGVLARIFIPLEARAANGVQFSAEVDAGGDARAPREGTGSPGVPRVRQGLADAAHLRSFRKEYGRRSRAGLLLHTGEKLEWLAPDVLAAPWWRVV